MATYAAASVAPRVTYPVTLEPPPDVPMNRLWGIPVVGFWVRMILAIPHALVMGVLGLGIYVILLLGWIPILLNGSVADIHRRWVEEAIHRGMRVAGYILLFPGGYPPLGIGEPGPVDVRFAIPNGPINRLWGIPILGFAARAVVAIPHLLIVSILGSCCGLIFLVLWIPILLNGRFPAWAMTLYAGTLRYAARVQAWLYMLPVPYPPFTLD